MYEIHSKGIQLTLATNGYLVEQHIDAIRRLTNLRVIISLDGFRATTHDNFRKKNGSFNKVINSINLLVENGIYVRVGVTIHKKNMEELDDLVQAMTERGIGIAFHSIIVSQNPTPELEAYMISAAQYNECVRRFSNNENVMFREIVANQDTVDDFIECPAGNRIIGVKPNGLYTPCHWISYQDSSFDSEIIADIFKFKMEDQYFNYLPCRACR